MVDTHDPLPRLMILAGYHPGSFSIGGILLADIARAYPRERLCSFSFSSQPPVTQEFDWLPAAFGNGFPEKGFSRSKVRAMRVLDLPWRFFSWERQVRNLVKDAVRFGREQRVEKIWGVCDYPTNILITRRVAEALNLPYVTTSWDPPDYIAYHRGLDRISTAWVMREFERMLRGSQGCGVASPNMAEEFSRLYGVRCVVMWHGIAQKLWCLPQSAPKESGKLTIAFAGSLYAKREFSALMDALDKCGWRIAGRDVCLRVLTTALTLNATGKAHVEYLGYRPLHETIRILSESDISYVPYWFDPDYRRVVSLSFPGKIAATLAAGRPVFFHGPEYSAPVRFLKRYPAGVICNSMEPDDIIASLEAFLSESSGYSRATTEGRIALEKELNLQTYVSRFAELIGVEPGKLNITRED